MVASGTWIEINREQVLAKARHPVIIWTGRPCGQLLADIEAKRPGLGMFSRVKTFQNGLKHGGKVLLQCAKLNMTQYMKRAYQEKHCLLKCEGPPEL